MDVLAPRLIYTNVTIADGQSLSDAVDIGQAKIVGIIMPASWTAAGMTFQGGASLTGTFYDVYDNGVERAVVIASSQFSVLNVVDWLPFRFIKFRSGTTGSAVAQSGDITFVVVTQP
jgi:hypothetical protein